MKKAILFFAFIVSMVTMAQESPNNGFIPSRVTTTERDAFTNPAKGLIIFNTTTNGLEINSGTGPAPVWESVGSPSAVPTASVFHLATATVPAGYLECNGAAISRTTYATLFANIGTTFGAGDGSTTFNLPDYRGEFIRGWDHGKGTDSGRALGTLQLDALQNITGNILGAGNSANGAFADTSNISSHLQFGAGFNDVSNYNFDASRVARTATETRPRNIALMTVIKF